MDRADENQIITRRNVWALSREKQWHPVIKWYARAVTEMQSNDDVADPRRWFYMANIHGTFLPRSQWPHGMRERDWNACQHGSWYFLPWQRMYLHHFETIVRGVVVALGGPADWALPFWDYNPEDAKTLALPPAFRAETTPDGDDNPLFLALRSKHINDGEPLSADRVETSRWTSLFTSRFAAEPTFGGPITGWTHSGPANGQLETEPHGLVHVDVGGRNPKGLMSLVETAARDPIFWLHHGNIDRLWEKWRNQEGHNLPTEEAWLERRFEFGRGESLTSLAVRDVLDTTAAPLRYRYEGMPVPGKPAEERDSAAAVRGPGDQGKERLDTAIPPELVGSSAEPVPLTDSANVVQIRVGSPMGPADRTARARPSRVYLALEKVTGSSLGAGSYTVHVNGSEDGDPAVLADRRAGRISMFGVMEASRRDNEHAGSGVTFAFDITDIVARLEATSEWDPAQVRVTITPESEPAPGAESDGVQVGRIAVYYR